MAGNQCTKYSAGNQCTNYSSNTNGHTDVIIYYQQSTYVMELIKWFTGKLLPVVNYLTINCEINATHQKFSNIM